MDDAVPSRTCSREQIRELDRRAMEDYGIPGVVLMENAGRGAAGIAGEMIGNPAKKRVVVFCGKGNNGGDGFVIARHLHNRGARVEVVAAFAAEELSPEADAGINLEIVRHMGIHPAPALDDYGRSLAAGYAKQADLIVDALLGTGLAGDVREPFLSLIRLVNAEDKPVLSVDVPSGLDANTGNILRAAVRATCTATFVLPKHGFLRGEGPACVGDVRVVDIGAPADLVDEILSS